MRLEPYLEPIALNLMKVLIPPQFLQQNYPSCTLCAMWTYVSRWLPVELSVGLAVLDNCLVAPGVGSVRDQVWSLTQFDSVDFSKSRIGVKCAFSSNVKTRLFLICKPILNSDRSILELINTNFIGSAGPFFSSVRLFPADWDFIWVGDLKAPYF